MVGFAGSRQDQDVPARELYQFAALSEDAKAEALPSVEGLQAYALPERDLAAAWWLFASDLKASATPDESPVLSVEDLAELLLDQVGLMELGALWRWLHGEQQWFRLRRDKTVQPRNRNDIRRDRLKQRQAQLAKQAAQHQLDLLADDAPISAERLAQLTPRWRQTLEQCLDLSCLDDASIRADTEIQDDLKALGIPPERGALRQWLIRRGLLDPHQPDGLRGSVWSAGFSDDLCAEADRLIERSSQLCDGDGQRLDLTGHSVYTVDDADTREIDDGLSLEDANDGLWIWIHIADPARLIAPGSALDLEARRRATSLYLADGTQPMLPMALAAGVLSLRAGHRCPALSVAVRLDDHGAIAEQRLERTWIKPRYGLTYEDADDLIELAPPGDDALSRLASLLQRRQRWRESQGALLFDRSEGRLRRKDDQLDLQIIDPCPSRLMVSEAMLLMGAAIAEFGRDSNLPLPFRSQPPAELPSADELQQIPEGPARDTAIKRCLSRGVQGTTPMAHFSLGLSAYVQATSPIRRYADLLVHRQLIACLDETPPMTESQLSECISDLENPLRQSIQISREDQRHWQRIWFAERKEELWSTQFLRWLRPQDRLALVHVDAMAMGLVGILEGAEPLVGDILSLRVIPDGDESEQLRLVVVS